MAKNKPKRNRASNAIRELLDRSAHEEGAITRDEPSARGEVTLAEAVETNKGSSAPVPEQKTNPMSRPQFYTWATAWTLADAAVQKDAEGVLDVISRNFENAGWLSLWLQKIGHGDKVKLGRKKDMYDYFRLVANALYRDLKREIGRPVSRW